MDNDKSAALAQINTINAVDDFDPASLAVDYTDMNTGETRKRLPVMAQVAWFRLKYPEGRFTINVAPGKDCFVATARVYKNYMDPVDCYLSEASASRGYLADKPTISPREWAQTAALGIALRNAGFGLQFGAVGDSFDETAVNELEQSTGAAAAAISDSGSVPNTETALKESGGTTVTDTATNETASDPLEAAMKLPCPISKYRGKTLGDMINLDPSALVWVANKFTGDTALNAAAKLICESAMSATA
jgi:hypothetical protein